MYPVLFELGGQPLYSYWFFFGLGMLLGVLTCLWLTGRRGLSFWRVWSVCFGAVIAAFACARVTFLYYDPGFDPLSALSQGGEVSFGGIFAALVAFIVLGKVVRLPLRDLLDAAAPAIFLAQAVQRIGCFCNGCCHGPVYDSVFSVRFPQIVNLQGEIIGTPCFQHHLALGSVDSSDLYSLPVVPMQVVSMAIGLLVAGVGVGLFLRGRLHGRLMWLSFALYGVLRFGTQWFRPNYDGNNLVWGWNTGHTFSLIMCLVGVSLLVACARATLKQRVPRKYARRLADPIRSAKDKRRLERIAARKCHV